MMQNTWNILYNEIPDSLFSHHQINEHESHLAEENIVKFCERLSPQAVYSEKDWIMRTELELEKIITLFESRS
jgi:ArsR family metal-binding transcriptional regulator